MLDAFRAVMGVYVPVTYVDGAIAIIPAGAAGVNWEYVISGIIFGLAIYSIFRLIGILLRG